MDFCSATSLAIRRSVWQELNGFDEALEGYAVAGGSDIALCADIIVMSTDARIGYMPTRVWGCPTTAMWVYRRWAVAGTSS